MRRIVGTIVLLALVSPVTTFADQVGLTEGIEAYWNADFERADSALRSVPVEQLSDDEARLLHKFLALCAVAQKEQDTAREEFLRLLQIDPAFRLDPREVAPQVLREFEQAQLLALKQAYETGKQRYLDGRYSSAASSFETALQIDPLNRFARGFLRLSRRGSTDSTLSAR